MQDYRIHFPDFFDDEEWIIESKGWIILVFTYKNENYELSFYDPVRLMQTINDDLNSSQYFLQENLIVIPNVNKRNIENVIQDLVSHPQLIENLKIKTGS
ncbi:hypothetical protein [Acinetobacter venetianus]|uniref:hypothetical protein n=1 Tax=Acinetobacter venetianus TaxID=52133 RepID=UPI00037CB45B|nr:hypothetical protein [Acinetobacter venetianus]